MRNLLKKYILNKAIKIFFFNNMNSCTIKRQSNKDKIFTLPLPDEFIIPIQDNIDIPSDIIVKKGDHVLKGQVLTKEYDNKIPIHATTSGTIISIEPHIIQQNSMQKMLCIKLRSDNKDQWCKLNPLCNYLQYSAEFLLSYIKKAGIEILSNVNLFTNIQLKNWNKLIHTLIINTTEHETYVSINDQLILKYGNEIIEGILILVHILRVKEVLIVIQNNKSYIHIIAAALKEALLDQQVCIKLKIIPIKYPIVIDKQLIKVLTGKHIPYDVHSFSIGIFSQNISTIFAIKRAIINGEPLIKRLITLTGNYIQNPGSYWVHLGTPINFLLEQVSKVKNLEKGVIIGNEDSLIRSTLHDFTVPIFKRNNYIFASTEMETSKSALETACIRCGFCAKVCPVNLLPQQLYWYSKSENHEKAERFNLSSCIECGVCAHICPSNIPLVDYFQKEKILIKTVIEEKTRMFYAKERFEAKKYRIKQEQILRQKQSNLTNIEIENQNKNIIRKLVMQTNSHKKQAINNIKLMYQKYFFKIFYVKKNNLHVTQKNIKHDKKESNITIETTSKQQANHLRKAMVAAAIERVKIKRDMLK